MALKELEASEVEEEKYTQVKKELRELKKAIDKSEKLIKMYEGKKTIVTTLETKELFIERKDKGKKAAADEDFDVTPGDHVLVEL